MIYYVNQKFIMFNSTKPNFIVNSFFSLVIMQYNFTTVFKNLSIFHKCHISM